MTPSSAEIRNIQAIVELERRTLVGRTRLDRVTDRVTALAGSGAFVVVHVVWFTIWIGFNVLSARPFDKYPYELLTLVVSLEAIVLTGFVLMAQNRMTQQADKRAHLDLQVNLLAEQELTAILKMLLALGQHAGVDLSGCDPGLEQLRAPTDVQTLASALDNELASAASTEPAVTESVVG